MEAKSNKVLIIVYSYHHRNTEKIANAMAEVFHAEVKTPKEVDINTLTEYEMIGFGAGIDSAKHYAPLLELAAKLEPVDKKKSFVFSTSAIIGESKVYKDHTALRDILIGKGYLVVNEFACKGFNTNSFLKYVGGMNKGKPNMDDLEDARNFANKLKQEYKF